MIRQIFNISFEYHFIGNIICIRVPFVKDYGIALTEIREKSSFSSHLLFRREGQRKTGFMFIGCMILLNSQIIIFPASHFSAKVESHKEAAPVRPS